MINSNTICAISTPVGIGGICIVRLSGDNAYSIAMKIFKSKEKNYEQRKLYLGKIQTKNFAEKGFFVFFKAPYSYTGEDMVEFQCHGGVLIAQGVLQECINNGAVLATGGEFTKRAFLNGKVDLSQAEGMIDMINAESDSEVKAGYSQLTGVFSSKIKVLQDSILDCLSQIDVSLDYPEHDEEFITKKTIRENLIAVKREMDDILSTRSNGKAVHSGINILILGKPNVGKSSLLNALVGEEKAIVTEISGTTRDIIEGQYTYKGVKFNIIDTAGIHDSENIVEAMGIDKAKKFIKIADIILFVIDGSKKMDEADEKVLKLFNKKPFIVIENKIDIGNIDNKFNESIKISAKKNEGIDIIKQRVYSKFIDEKIVNSGIILTNERHYSAIFHAEKLIMNVLSNLGDMTLDVLAVDIESAWQCLGEITGTTANEEIINSIFSKFCLGK